MTAPSPPRPRCASASKASSPSVARSSRGLVHFQRRAEDDRVSVTDVLYEGGDANEPDRVAFLSLEPEAVTWTCVGGEVRVRGSAGGPWVRACSCSRFDEMASDYRAWLSSTRSELCVASSPRVRDVPTMYHVGPVVGGRLYGRFDMSFRPGSAYEVSVKASAFADGFPVLLSVTPCIVVVKTDGFECLVGDLEDALSSGDGFCTSGRVAVCHFDGSSYAVKGDRGLPLCRTREFPALAGSIRHWLDNTWDVNVKPGECMCASLWFDDRDGPSAWTY